MGHANKPSRVVDTPTRPAYLLISSKLSLALGLTQHIGHIPLGDQSDPIPHQMISACHNSEMILSHFKMLAKAFVAPLSDYHSFESEDLSASMIHGLHLFEFILEGRPPIKDPSHHFNILVSL